MWFFNLFTILLIVITDNSASKASNQIIIANNGNKSMNNIASECIIRIAKDHFSCNSVIFIVSYNDQADFFVQSINEYYCFSIITRSFTERSWWVYPDAYFISADNATHFLTGLHEISKDLSWNPKANFVILFSASVTEITEIFKELLNLMIFNVVLLTNTKNGQLEAFTHYVHSYNYCFHNASSVRSLGYCPTFNETLFSDEIQNSFVNCTVIVAVKEDVPYILYNKTKYIKYLRTGAEQYVIDTVAQKVGIRIKYKFTTGENFSLVLPNRTSTGLLNWLLQHEADMIAGGLFLTANRLEVFDCIYGYSYATFSVITPTLKEERWSRVYKQFDVITWFLIIVSFLFTLLVILVTKTLTTGNTDDTVMLILKLWRYFYGHADCQLFKDTYIRRFLIVWIIFTTSITAFYNTASYSLITGHVQNKIKINHSDIAALPFKPCITDPTRFYFLSVYNESFPKNPVNNDVDCQNSDMVFNRVAMRNDFYTIDTDYAYYLYAGIYLDSEGQPVITHWDYPRTDNLCIYLTRGFPLREKFQRYAITIYETGLLSRHLSYIHSKKLKPLPTLKRKYEVIRLKDFKIPYCVLMIGSLVSFICFIMEYKTGNN